MSERRQIAVGDSVVYDDIDCTVESIVTRSDSPPTVILRAVDGSTYHVLGSVLADVLVQASAAGGAAERSIHALRLLPDAVKAEVADLLPHLNELATGFRSGSALDPRPGEPLAVYQASLPIRQRVSAKAEELGVSESTVWRAWRRFNASGAAGLIDGRRARRADPLEKADPRLIEAMKAAIAQETSDSTGSMNRLKRRVGRELADTYGDGVVAMPTAPTFNKYAMLLRDGPRVTADAPSRRSAAVPFDRSFSVIRATRPGEVVMMDATPFDVFAFDPETGSSFPVELAFAIDVCTRSILAWKFVPLGMNRADASLMLADALFPEPMRPGWPDSVRYKALSVPIERMVAVDERLELAAARPVMVPETIVIDHGKVYVSQAFQDACRVLGVSLQYARKGQGTDKANVERLFGTVRTLFAEHISGYKGRSVSTRGLDPEGLAAWTIAQLEEFFAEFVVLVYQRRTHRGLAIPGWPDVELCPNDAYNLAVSRTGVVQMPPNPGLYFQLLPTAWCAIRRDGVTLNSLQYRSKELHAFAGVKSGHKNGKWPVSYDPRDRRHIYFQDPNDGTWSKAEWIHAAELGEPFSDRTFDAARCLVRERGGKPTDQDQVAEALVDLQNRTDLPEPVAKRQRKRAFTDAERGRHAARDRERAGLPDAMLHLAPPALVVEDEPFELGDLDSVVVFDPKRRAVR